MHYINSWEIDFVNNWYPQQMLPHVLYHHLISVIYILMYRTKWFYSESWYTELYEIRKNLGLSSMPTWSILNQKMFDILFKEDINSLQFFIVMCKICFKKRWHFEAYCCTRCFVLRRVQLYFFCVKPLKVIYYDCVW